MELAVDENIRISAERTRQIYDEYLRVNFTEKQAMQLIIAEMTGVEWDDE